MLKILTKGRPTTGLAAFFAPVCLPDQGSLKNRRRCADGPARPCGPLRSYPLGPLCLPRLFSIRCCPSPYKPRFDSLLAIPAARRYHSRMRGTKDGKPDTSDGTDGKPAARPDAQPTREERLAEALRENLKKRKAQTRARAARKPDQQTDET